MNIKEIHVTSDETLAIRFDLTDSEIEQLDNAKLQSGADYWIEAWYNVMHENFSDKYLDTLEGWDSNDIKIFLSCFVNDINPTIAEGNQIRVGVFTEKLQASPLYDEYLQLWEMEHAGTEYETMEAVDFDEWYYNEFQELYDDFEIDNGWEFCLTFGTDLYIYDAEEDYHLSAYAFTKLLGFIAEEIKH